jgi:branched-chain amino acid transport system permease protein
LVLDSDYRVYYFFLLVIAAAAFVSYRIKDSKYGRALLSVRDDELAAEVLGMNATSLKVQAFVISAFFAGLAGSLYAHLVAYICPEVFGFSVSLAVPTMMVFGGIGSIPGSALGAVALTVLPELLRVGKQYYMLLYGIGLFVMLVFKPTGIAGLADEVAVRFRALRGGQSAGASVLRAQETPTGRGDVESGEC